MTSYMYNPSKKVTELLSKFLEFDPEQLQLGVWSGDLVLANVNLREDALYSKINRMKKSPSGRDPLKLKLVEGKIGLLRIQIPWKRLVWGKGDVIIDIKDVNAVVGFETREETEARQAAAAAATSEEETKDDSQQEGYDDDDAPVQCSKEFRDAKQKVLAEAEERLMEGQYLASWLAQMMKNELNVDKDANQEVEEKIAKGFEKWMKKASSNIVWRFLSGLQVNIEGFKLVVVQDNIEVGVIMPNTRVHSGKKGENMSNNNNNLARASSGLVENEAADNKSTNNGGAIEPANMEDAEVGNTIEKTIEATGVSVFARRQPMLQIDTGGPQRQPHHQSAALLPDDYILRPIDFVFSLNFFYPHEDQQRKRKNDSEGVQGGSPDNTTAGGETSVASSKRRRGKREKHPKQGSSMDGTAETDVGSSFAPDHLAMQRQRSGWTQDSNEFGTVGESSASRGPGLARSQTAKGLRRNEGIPGINRTQFHRRAQSGFRSAPLVRPDDLGSVYASVMAESVQLTPKLALSVNCGEIKLLCSSQHLDTMNNFFACGARMRNGRPTCTIAEVLAKGDKTTNKRGSAGIDDTQNSHHLPGHQRNFPSRRMSLGMGIRNEVAAKAISRRSRVVRSWWHYAYSVVAYEIQKRKRRRDNFRDKYVSFDWDRQKRKRKEYVNLYLSLHLDVGQHVDCDASVQSPGAEELLRIEDDLPIEQILLYRSIGRALHQHEMQSMPSSLEILYNDYTIDLTSAHRRASIASSGGGTNELAMSKRLSMHDHRLKSSPGEDEEENLLSMIGQRCDNNRKYRSYLSQDNVELFHDPSSLVKAPIIPNEEDKKEPYPNVRDTSAGAGTDSGAPDNQQDSKLSFSYDDYSEEMEAEPEEAPKAAPRSRRKVDNTDRTVRTMMTSKSAMAGTIMENMTQAESQSKGGAKISFSLVFRSVELMLVADERNAPAMVRPSSKMSVADSSSSDDVSELSFLSEEDFFREQESAPAAAVEEEAHEKPMLSSTDFLLFGLPKNMLLHIILSPLRCTLLGRAGASKNINFTVGTITASGGSDGNLVAIGSRASPTPVPVVSLSKKDSGSSHERKYRFNAPSATGPKEAVTFSLVINDGQKLLQADVSKVYLNLDVPLLMKLADFPSAPNEGNPTRMLPKSHREEARFFILRENPPSKLTEINSSIRIHGVDVSMPVDAVGQTAENLDSSDSSDSGSFGQPERNVPSAHFSAKIIEMYSGTAVNDLCNTETVAQVGSLAMLDVEELVSSRGTLSSHHAVMAVSGINCALNSETDVFAFSKAPSLLAEPIDLEILLTTNGSTLLDEDSPRQEIVVEVSPVHILLSDTRLLFCSRVMQPWKTLRPKRPGVNQDTSMPPRLEALSRLVMRCIDVSIRGVQLSLLSDEQKYPLTPGQKEIIMEECIGDFLSVVSCFNLQFPNEDALSSAMQVCIDRLSGLGLPADDAWDCANEALMSFLEDDAHREMSDPSGTGENNDASSQDGTTETKKKKDSSVAIDQAISNAVAKSLQDFPPPDDEMDPERQPSNNLLVVDLPGGANVSTIQLFYDFHLAASLPSLFVSNTAGVRLVRIVPVESNNYEGEPGADYDGEPSQPGLVFSRFLLDADYAFGKGGLPLSVLGSDERAEEDTFVRIREKQDDVQIGEFEYLFSHKSYVDMMGTISKLKSCVASTEEPDANKKEEEGGENGTVSLVKSSFFARSEIASVLLASDALVPFSRLRFESLYLKKDGKPIDPHEAYVPLLKLIARTFTLLNLGEEGQFYPDAISVLYSEDMTSFPFQLEFTSNSPPWQLGSKMNLVLRGFRVFLVRQFINELLQYLLNERHGVGKLKHASKIAAEEAEKSGKSPKNTNPPLAYKIHVLDSSLLLPRSRNSHDMAAIEIAKGLISNSRHHNSFKMPTQTSSFQSEQERGSGFDTLFTRMNFQLHEMRIFSSLGEEKSYHNHNDSPVFRYFYDVDGRAEDGGWVYNKQPDLFDGPPKELAAAFEALSNRRWKEITTDLFSLDVLVDYAPNLRVLISEPLDPENFIVAPRLDVRLSQFCLLVSIWYANMQELPVMFPYSTTQFMGGRDLRFGTIPTEYGTDEYMAVWDDWSCVKTEICILLRNLSMRCTFDPTGYFDAEPEIKPFYDDPDDPLKASSVQIYFTDVVVHTYSDLRGMMRVAVAAAGFDMIDERRNKHCQRTFAVSKLSSESDGEDKFSTWGDLHWGLHNDVRNIDQTLDQPFQLSCFMTKDWALINLGLESANGVLVELSPIWFFLGFFVSYWQDAAYGNPGYAGQGKARVIKNVLGASRKIDLKDPEGMNIDFRLWLSKPHLCIPCDLVDSRAPSLRIESETGLWYRFRSINDYKMQEVVSSGLDLLFANEFLPPRQPFDSRDRMVRHLVEGLSFGLRLDGNNECNHADYALQIPFDMKTTANLSIRSHELNVTPMILDAPTICSPVETPTRFLGPHVCEITCILEVLPLTSSVMVNFFKGPVDENIQANNDEEEEPGTFSFSGNIGDLRLFAVDPVLGVQLPVAVISISSIVLTASHLSHANTNKSEVSRGESIPEDLQVTVGCHLWGDYFKLGVTRSWEPLLEPYKCTLLYEKSKYRGQGMSLNADCPLHVNVSGALLLIIDEVVDSFSRLIKEVFGQDTEQESERLTTDSSLLRDRLTIGERIRLRGDQYLPVIHDIPKPLLGDRVAFSFCNLTGQKVRIHQQEGFDRLDGRLKPAVVTYLDHDGSTSLSFDATISVIKNLSVVEVPYPGLPNSQSMRRAKRSSKHAVDVQLPGFRWVQGIKVDTFGRKFESLRPRSPNVSEKVFQDWRLDNALQLLVEVGLDNGGRLVTVRSLFEVRNNTSHPLSLLLHPDPQHNPESHTGAEGKTTQKDETRVDAVSVVQPGEFYQIPAILLESSLNMGGSHLGSLWLKPDSHDNVAIPSLVPGIGHEGSGETSFDTRFCSKPVQLAKLVDESAVIFEGNGDSEVAPEMAKTGIQMACAVKSKAGEQLAPFCYAVEVGRSPIVPEKRASSNSFSGGSGRFDSPDIHGPVSYTLSIHAPFVITNLLPETGRFELMHAVRRTVLWYGDLKPGQQMPVHSVGLDAPLLLLLNLGFCRTPVGEGALVHHGADLVAGSKENLGLKSLVGKSAGAVGKAVTKSTGAVGKVVTKSTGAVGKVATKGTKLIGKTLTSISDSPDKRALGDIQPTHLGTEPASQLPGMNGQSLGFDEGLSSMNSPDGKVHAVESTMYSPNDVAAETAVVDSIGQRLTLSIENIRGGGGQRRIGVYCPFWIVNTTQHSLRYKQESGKSFVCGTVLDAERDGSKPVDGSTRNYVNRHQLARATRMSPQKHLRSQRPMNEGTIFAGTAGALATSPGRCDLSPNSLTELIDKDLPLEKMANLAFMFNFHEDVLSIGNRRLTLQLADATEHVPYYSDWSRGFSLDSVGFSQIVALHCKEGRALELSVVVSVAPGFLSGYTKIVRLVPRYVLVNQLDHPVRLWQDSSVFRTLNEDRTTTGIDELVRGTDLGKWRFASAEDEELSVINQYEALWGRITLLEETDAEKSLEGTTAHRNASYITSAGPLEFVPFHLPDSRGERQLRIGLGGAWNLTASFASDFPGDHSLRLTRAVDLRFVRHVSTRASSQYKVTLPPPRSSGGHEWDGELGIWFETDWGGDRRIIVKGMKRGRYCFNETDIHAGDELLRIDNISVSRMPFAETMKLLKQRVTQVAAAAANSGQRPSLKDTNKMGESSMWMSLRRRGNNESTDDGSEVTEDRMVLTFRTLEERLRRLRMKAAKHRTMNLTGRAGGQGGGTGGVDSASQASHQGDNGITRALGGLRVEMKPLHHSMFVVLQKEDPDNPPFRIENRSLNHTIFYRQRGCEGHSWNNLKPGQSQAYSWEEPMRQKRLAVRASRDGLFLSRPESEVAADENSVHSIRSDGASREVEHRAARSATLRQLLSFHQYIEDEEQGRFGTSTTVKLEEIGYRGLLSCPSSKEDGDSHKTRLNVEVETDGATRILVVSDEIFHDDEVSVMNKRLETLKRQTREEESRAANLAALRYLLINPSNSFASGSLVEGMALSNISLYAQQVEDLKTDEKFTAIDELARNITDDFPEDTTIHARHQVVVEVLEAVGLNPDNEIGSCNPYCEVLLKGRSKLRKSFFERRMNRGKTYYQKKSLSPKWTGQIFVFDVPPEAVSVTRGHSIHVRLRNFRYVGAHKLLGQAIVHLHSVRNQEELVGWYPLAGRTGSTELDNPLSHWGRGSVKLRIHWVHSTSALLDYFIMFTEKRLLQLQERKDGLKDQWKQASDAEKRKKERDQSKSALTHSVQKVSKEKSSSKRLAQQTREMEGKDGAPSKNISMIGIARDRTKLVSNFLKYAKKKRRRRGEDDDGDDDDDDPNFEFGSEAWGATSTDLPRIMEDNSSSSSGSSDSNTSLFDMSGSDDTAQDIPKSLNRGSLVNRNFAAARTKGKVRIQRPRTEKPPERSFVRATGKLFANKLLKRLSQRTLIVPEDEKNGNDSNDSDSFHDNDPNGRVSKRFSNLDTIKELLEHGYVFHEVKQYFHKLDPYSFYGRTDDGASIHVPRVKDWSSAQALLNDETLDVNVTGSTYELVINNSVVAPRVVIDSGGSHLKSVARKMLQLPSKAPLSMAQRSLQHVEYLVQSRNQFERASRRTLRSVLNPGGWLTIRPITALNLPDTYTGMHVKLRYGPEVVVSSSVDAKVTPTWTPKDVMHRVNTMPDVYEGVVPGEGHASDVPPALNMDRFEFYENDLLFYVEPQKTSGSIRLSVVGERLNNKSELGVLHIPLGAAIGSCIDCIEDYMDSSADSAPSATPMYIRWFPLMNPKETDPVEGDMGLSARPPETEKLGDDMFQQYFAPCIQLALMWWPDDRNTDFEVEEEMSEYNADGSQSFHPGPNILEGEKALTNNYFNADIGRISCALIDSDRAKELLSFSAIDIDVRYSVTDSKTRMGLVIGWVQLDHQEDKSREPVVLAPKPVEHIQPTCQLLVVKDNLRSKKNIVSYEHIRLTVEEMDLTVEESWLFDLWDFFIGVVRRREVRKKANRSFAADTKRNQFLSTESRFIDIESSEPEAPSLLSLLVGEHSGGDGSSGKVYVEQLVLGLLKVNLSYVKGKKQTWELTEKGDWVSKTFDPNYQAQNDGEDGDPSELFTRWSQHTNDEDLWAERQGKRSQNLKGIIGAVLPNVSDAPIRLQGKVLDNVFESPSEILSSISKFYVMETLRQVYKIVGSLDFVGNPTMIFSSFVSGVRDLVVTPSVAFLRSPTNPSLVGTAVAKGTLSLFSHSTSGIFGFIAKTTAAAGQATAMLSFDPEYREWHRDRVVTEATNLNREWKKRGVESVSAMVMKPVGDLVLGVAMGVSGLFTAPYKGYRSGGNLGLAQGVAIGGIGLITKPIVGLLDAFAHFTASVHDVAKSVNILERRYQPVLKLRLPYTFALNNVLTPFDSVSARSAYLLKTFPFKSRYKIQGNKAPQKEIHIASEVLHMEPGVDTYSIVTTLRVVLIKVKRESGGRLGPTLCWEVGLAKEEKVKSQVSDHGHNGVALTITRRYKPSRGRRKKNSQGTPASERSQVDKSMDSDEHLNEESPGDEGDADASQILESTTNERTAKVHWEDTDNKEDAYHGHGATQGDAGETLEWFTVLAEYPNRPQLTRIHNAISCMLGNFDAVTKEQQRLKPGLNMEGCTTFGLFEFGENSSDELQHKSAERFLMAALERLPWMQDSAFDATRGKLPDEQRAIVKDIRDKWVFSLQLEASIRMGGPAWLVEARAHGMFVPSESPMPPPPIPRTDPIVKQILYQQEHGNISCEQVRMLFDRHLGDLQLQLPLSPLERKTPESCIWRKTAPEAESDDYESSFTELARYNEHQAAFSKVSTTVVHPGKDRPNLADFDGHLDAFETAYDMFPTTVVRPGSAMSASYDDSDDDDFESVNSNIQESTRGQGNLVPSNLEELARGNGNQTELKFNRPKRLKIQEGPKPKPRTPGSRDGPAAEDRIGRMEGLMEQLVVFNSQLALMKGPSLVGGAVSMPAGAKEQNAGALQEEMSLLRDQLERQAEKDEATTEVLFDLRAELAAIREGLAQKDEADQPKQKKKKEKKKEKQLKRKEKMLQSQEGLDPEMPNHDIKAAAKEKKKPRGSMRFLKGFRSSSKRNKKKFGEGAESSVTSSVPPATGGAQEGDGFSADQKVDDSTNSNFNEANGESGNLNGELRSSTVDFKL